MKTSGEPTGRCAGQRAVGRRGRPGPRADCLSDQPDRLRSGGQVGEAGGGGARARGRRAHAARQGSGGRADGPPGPGAPRDVPRARRGLGGRLGALGCLGTGRRLLGRAGGRLSGPRSPRDGLGGLRSARGALGASSAASGARDERRRDGERQGGLLSRMATGPPRAARRPARGGPLARARIVGGLGGP